MDNFKAYSVSLSALFYLKCFASIGGCLHVERFVRGINMEHVHAEFATQSCDMSHPVTLPDELNTLRHMGPRQLVLT